MSDIENMVYSETFAAIYRGSDGRPRRHPKDPAPAPYSTFELPNGAGIVGWEVKYDEHDQPVIEAAWARHVKPHKIWTMRITSLSRFTIGSAGFMYTEFRADQENTGVRLQIHGGTHFILPDYATGYAERYDTYPYNGWGDESEFDEVKDGWTEIDLAGLLTRYVLEDAHKKRVA